MTEFTYKLPPNDSYFKAILMTLKNKPNVYDILKNGYCEIYNSDSYSRKRWDAMATTINFYIPQDVYGKNSDKIDTIKQSLVKVCQNVMPANAGYDITEVNISPMLDEDNKEILADIIDTINVSHLNILSDEIKTKGVEMSELYAVLYCIENSLRNVIDKILTESFGVNYFDNIVVPKDVKKGIETRKKDEALNKWLPLRGDKDIFYLDFIDLAKLIENNWNVFKTIFPTQAWISTKIEELYKVRCLIAHNSYVGEDEKNMVYLYYKLIVKQISQ